MLHFLIVILAIFIALIQSTGHIEGDVDIGQVVDAVEVVIVAVSAVIGWITGWFQKRQKEKGKVKKIQEEYERLLRYEKLNSATREKEKELKNLQSKSNDLTNRAGR